MDKVFPSFFGVYFSFQSDWSSHTAKQCRCKAIYCPRWMENFTSFHMRNITLDHIRLCTGYGWLSYWRTSSFRTPQIQVVNRAFLPQPPPDCADFMAGVNVRCPGQVNFFIEAQIQPLTKMTNDFDPDLFCWKMEWQVCDFFTFFSFFFSIFCCPSVRWVLSCEPWRDF